MTRKVVRRIGVGAVVAAGVLLIAYATLHLPFVRARVLERAREYALRELGIVVDASSLHYAILARSIELRDVSLASSAGETPFLKAEAIRLVLDRSVFRGVVAVDRLDLVGPRWPSFVTRTGQPTCRAAGRHQATRRRWISASFRSTPSRSTWLMNQPVARLRSDQWTCHSTRHPGSHDPERLDQARSASGCRHHSRHRPLRYACRPARLRRRPSHGPRPAHRRRGRPARVRRVRRRGRKRSASRHSRSAGRGCCTGDAIDG